MGYRLAEQNGESVAVPRLVFAHLARADGDTIRAALYLLGPAAEPIPAPWRGILACPALRPPSAPCSIGPVPGCWSVTGMRPCPKSEMQKASAIDLTTLNDPYVSVLCEEAQTAFGKALSRTEMQRLVSLYLNDGWQPDVVLLCCAEVARQGRRTVGALSRELLKWRDAGVETGEDAERYLKQQAQRESWCIESAALFGHRPLRSSAAGSAGPLPAGTRTGVLART